MLDRLDQRSVRLQKLSFVCKYHRYRVFDKSNAELGTITKTVDVAYLILTSKSRRTRYPEYQCSISKQQLQTYVSQTIEDIAQSVLMMI